MSATCAPELPAQTVRKGERAYHQPIRLITVIETPLAFVQRVLSRAFKVRELVGNGWICLLVSDRAEGDVHLFEQGNWIAQPWTAHPEDSRPFVAQSTERIRKRPVPVEMHA